MIKRHRRGSDELLLIPFLDILCSLIGVLVLIIVVLCVAQSQKVNGRTPQELEQARKYQEMTKNQKEQEKLNDKLQEKLENLEKLKKELAEKEERIAKLRKLLAAGNDIKKLNEELSQNLVKELDNLLLEIEGLVKSEADMKKQIAALMEEIKKRQPPEKKTVPPVLVQPAGSGLAEGTKVFFVEASGGKLTIYWDAKNKTVLSAAPEVVAADAAYNYLLTEALKVPKSKIIFLLRDDGMGAYNNAAGWAQATYGYRVDQIGKLPIPGRGEINLQAFAKFQGTMAPPPPAPAIPAPAPVAPPAKPATTPPATGTPPAKPPTAPPAVPPNP
jgi:ABC-type multidrug transport system fused ATPase/permease subunit